MWPRGAWDPITCGMWLEWLRPRLQSALGSRAAAAASAAHNGTAGLPASAEGLVRAAA